MAVFLATLLYNKYFCEPDECRKLLDNNKQIYDLVYRSYTEVKQEQRDISNDFRRRMEDTLKDVKKMQEMFAIAECLRTNMQIIDIEGTVKCGEPIYVVTAYFKLEIYNESMRRTIAQNLIRKGVTYHYIIPNTAEREFGKIVYAVMAEVKNMLKGNDNRMELDDDIVGRMSAVTIEDDYIMMTMVCYLLDTEESDGKSLLLLQSFRRKMR